MDRREFLRGLGAGLAAGAAGGGLMPFSGLRAAELRVTPEAVRFLPDMEPVVRWIESTPRDKVLERALEEIKKGLPYRKLLGGLFLAGIRNIKPRPVGFKFHAVLVMSSAHQLALDAHESERLLPFFWALDNFKSSQEQDEKEGDWQLAPVKESAVPSPGEARKRFQDAMDRWDSDAADVAVAGLCRSAGAGEVMEALWPYGLRDWQNIGHKIIFASGAWRTLQVIGWEHAEPVLRSLVYAILNGGPGETSAPYEPNRALAGQVRPDWPAGKADRGAALGLLEALRRASPPEAAREAAALLDRGVSPASVWDGILLAACDLLIRSPGIVALHAVTASNALHQAYQASGRDTTRLLALLQAASWIAFYREGVRGRGGLPDEPRLEALEAAEPPRERGALLETMGRDRRAAARQVLSLAGQLPEAEGFMDAARSLVFAKGNDSHDYKFAASAFEEFGRASPDWRPRLLAASAYLLPAATEPDSQLIRRARQALVVRAY